MSDDKAKSRPAAPAGRSPAAAPAAGAKAAAGGKEIAKRDESEGEETKPGMVRWALGWIVLPGSVIGAIFGAGALVGAHFHDSWFTRAIVWFGDLF